jgi:hypothetical protein
MTGIDCVDVVVDRAGGRLLWMWRWTSRCHKMRESSSFSRTTLLLGLIDLILHLSTFSRILRKLKFVTFRGTGELSIFRGTGQLSIFRGTCQLSIFRGTDQLSIFRGTCQLSIFRGTGQLSIFRGLASCPYLEVPDNCPYLEVPANCPYFHSTKPFFTLSF